MLNSEKAILAMNDVDDSYLECAREMLGYKAEVKIRSTIRTSLDCENSLPPPPEGKCLKRLPSL